MGKERNRYTKEDLQFDIGWLIGQGVDKSKAESFILRLLNKEYVD